MQTLSSMRRSSFNKKTLTTLFALVLFGIYCFLSDIYVFLPPLIGFCFVIFSQYIKQGNYFGIFIIFLYLSIFEFDKSMPFGLLAVLFLFGWVFFIRRIEVFVKTGILAYSLYILFIYFLYSLSLSFIDFFYKEEMILFGSIIFIHIIIEILLVFVYELKK